MSLLAIGWIEMLTAAPGGAVLAIREYPSLIGIELEYAAHFNAI
jgi:hypothetical protein